MRTTLLTGLMVGVVGALSASAVMRSMVYGISARNPLVMLSAVVVMTIVAFVAVFVPLLRATRVNPVHVLRAE